MRKDPKNIESFITEALAIEAQEAQEAGAVGFMARALTQATMPHSKPKEGEHSFKRTNGTFKLTMMAHPDYGLPYGTIPRLLVAWMTTEAVRTKSPVLELGSSLSNFMHQLGLAPTGGRWGTITRLKTQTQRLVTTAISCTNETDTISQAQNMFLVKNSQLWWHPTNEHQMPLWNSKLELGDDFYKEAISKPVPIDMRALKLLKQSALALDIYIWLTYRMSYLKKDTVIPWEALQMQFGGGLRSH